MIREIDAKTIVQKVKFDNTKWFGIDYNMNLYKGCCHGCIYCDSRSVCYGIDCFNEVRTKKNALTLLSKELLTKRKKGVVGIGAMSDTYNPFEKDLEITRKALAIIRDTGFGVALDTKSSLVTRDIDILKQINTYHDVIIKISITCANDDLSKIIEKNVDVSSKRFAALQQLSQAGIFCGVLLMPLLPYINDTEENIIEIVKKSHQAGAKFIYPMFGVTLRDRQREHFYQNLDIDFPTIANTYKQTFGSSYICNSQNSKRLYSIFKQECQKYGILYTMNDIICAYKSKEEVFEQLSFKF